MSESIRRASILEAAIREFIATGEPVSSGHLYERYDFGIKPAMIRLELTALTDEGFLEQPHHSAGRIPSDRGYEFFASRAIEDAKEEEPRDHELLNCFADEAWGEVAKLLASDLGLLGAVSPVSRESTYKEGLENLIDKLEWNTRNELKSVIHDFEELDHRIEELGRSLATFHDIHAFIGKKSPITRSEDLSVLMGRYEVGDGNLLLFAIGPKRMNYQKVAKTFKGLKNATQKKNYGRTTKAK